MDANVESRVVHGHIVRGLDVDAKTRCRHYHGVRDIIALKFRCCGCWYPCFQCHTAAADHPATVWPLAERGTRAVLCGACGYLLGIDEYLGCDSRCPACGAGFNPGCARHHHLYFEPG
jgi:uncharacterized CHY-type Zn-finger protein